MPFIRIFRIFFCICSIYNNSRFQVIKFGSLENGVGCDFYLNLRLRHAWTALRGKLMVHTENEENRAKHRARHYVDVAVKTTNVMDTESFKLCGKYRKY